MIPAKIMINKIIAIGIHNGENTHHQLQVATIPQPPNLRVKNIRKSIVPIPNPDFFELLSDIIFLF
jgi:hypothetical protein